jgi:hypothetical protein
MAETLITCWQLLGILGLTLLYLPNQKVLQTIARQHPVSPVFSDNKIALILLIQPGYGESMHHLAVALRHRMGRKILLIWCIA